MHFLHYAALFFIIAMQCIEINNYMAIDTADMNDVLSYLFTLHLLIGVANLVCNNQDPLRVSLLSIFNHFIELTDPIE